MNHKLNLTLIAPSRPDYRRGNGHRRRGYQPKTVNLGRPLVGS